MAERKKRAGFTLIELLVVIMILALLAGLAVPKLMGKVKGAKVKTAQTQIEIFSNTLDSLFLDVGRFPSTSEGLNALWVDPGMSGWAGPYLKKSLPKDPWGNDYVYKCPGDHDEYDVSSLGADGLPGGDGDDADITSWK